MTVLSQQIPAGTWRADKVHSTVGFAVKHSGVATFRGSFSDYDGTLTVVGDGEPQLTGVVSAASIDVRDDNLAGISRARTSSTSSARRRSASPRPPSARRTTAA
jgi:polyisoprenoid-binding protein YceI